MLRIYNAVLKLHYVHAKVLEAHGDKDGLIAVFTKVIDLIIFVEKRGYKLMWHSEDNYPYFK